MAMATSVCLTSPLATAATAVRAIPSRASTSYSARRRPFPRRLRRLGSTAAGMDAFHVSSRDAEPLLHTAAAANATHRRLRVRTHAQGVEDISTGAGDGAAAEADYSLAAIILPCPSKAPMPWLVDGKSWQQTRRPRSLRQQCTRRSSVQVIYCLECRNWNRRQCVVQISEVQGSLTIDITTEREYFELKKMCKVGAYWGAVAGLYVGVEYGVDRIRGCYDWNKRLHWRCCKQRKDLLPDKIAKDANTGGAIATASSSSTTSPIYVNRVYGFIKNLIHVVQLHE